MFFFFGFKMNFGIFSEKGPQEPLVSEASLAPEMLAGRVWLVSSPWTPGPLGSGFSPLTRELRLAPPEVRAWLELHLSRRGAGAEPRDERGTLGGPGSQTAASAMPPQDLQPRRRSSPDAFLAAGRLGCWRGNVVTLRGWATFAPFDLGAKLDPCAVGEQSHLNEKIPSKQNQNIFLRKNSEISHSALALWQ